MPKLISMPMVCSVQTVHLSYAENNNTISKRIEMSFLLTNVS